MLGLACESGDLLLAPFALRYILKAVDRADNVSIGIPDCLDVDERDAAQAIRSLDMYFPFAHGNAGAQHVCHGALMVWQQTPVGPEHSIRSAKPFIGIAEFGRPAPQFGSTAIVSQNQTVPVTNINGKWQLFEKPRGQFQSIIIVMQTYGDPRYIAIASMEALTGLRR